MSYYHTYRPQQFGHLVGQEHIVRVLQEALRRQRLSHAYLFCGTRGTGKTTTARLLAKAVNCLKADKSAEPCNECQLCLSITNGNCLDVIEIDAASNRSIDEVRQLQEQIRFSPQMASRKVVIIDEAHMLTKEAFNALLKTLEEPPTYLIFILATTEAHKLPATIVSRCQRFDFATPNVEALRNYLERLAKSEKLKLDENAYLRIAQLANGSFRDSSTILEQLSGSKEPISSSLIDQLLGLPEEGLVARYLYQLAGSSDDALLADLEGYFDRGGDPSAFVDQVFLRFGRDLRQRVDIGEPTKVLAILTRIKYQLKYSPLGQLPVLAAVTVTNPSVKNEEPLTVVPKVLNEPKKKLTTDKVSVGKKKSVAPSDHSPATDTITVSVAEQVEPAQLPDSELAAMWNKAVDQLVTDSQPSLASILRTARPLAWHSPNITIGVQFAFHAEQLRKTKNRDILEAILTSLLGVPVKVEVEVAPPLDDLTAAIDELAI